MAELTAQQRRQSRGLILMILVSLFSSYVFFLGSNKVEPVTFGFVVGDEWALVQEWIIASRAGAAIFTLVSLFGVFIGYLEFKAKRALTFSTLIVTFGFIMSFLCWIASGKFIPFTGLLQGALMLSIPLIFGSMSGLLSEKSGVINIAIEGQLLLSAFVSGIIASLTQSTIWGLVVAPFAGALISLLLAIFAIKYAVDQVIIGFVINILVIGLTGFLYTELLIPFEEKWNSGPSFSNIAIPFLSKIPVIGPILFNQTIIIYLMYLIVFFIQITLFKSKWGLRTRAIGEMPMAADSVGIDVNRLRFINVLLSGFVAGIGGAYFTVGAVGSFSKQMTAGAGFIALAALIFGKWTVKGAVIASLFFGFANNLQGTLSIIGVSIPSEFMLMVPYIATIIVVSGIVGRVRAPAADGIPYIRGKK